MKEPRDIVKKILDYRTSGSVLDLGAGVGRHAIFLAEKGFNVTAVDLKKIPLENLQKNVISSGLDIKIIKSDIAKFKPDNKYDIVLATMSLHFLLAKEIMPTIKMMQDSTNSKGLNIISAYTDKNLPGLRPYMFKTSELRNYYPDWKILYYEEHQYFIMDEADIKDDGPRERYRAELIAEKP